MRLYLAALALPAVLAAGSCGAVRDSLEAPERVVLPAEDAQLERDLRSGVPEELVPVLEAVLLALEEGDELHARRSLAMLFARQPAGRALELGRAFERILDGRARIGWLDLRLEAIEESEPPGAFRLELVVSQHGPEDLSLRPGGAHLRVVQVAVDPDGRERRGSRRDAVPFPDVLELPEGGPEQRLVVARLVMNAPADVLAFSSRFVLELLPGEFLAPDGRYLPAQHLPAPELELVRLAKVLPTAALPAEELAEYVARGRIFVPALLERAVRIPPEGRGHALDLLAPEVATMNVVELELVVPALRWLARTSRPGGDPEAWREWMARRSRGADPEEPPGAEALRLPAR